MNGIYGIHQCANCGKDYKKNSKQHNCCCKKCASSLWYESTKQLLQKWVGKCINCGNEFESSRTGKNKHIYCSPKCRRQYVSKQKKEAMEPVIKKTCPICQKDFEYQNNSRNRIYCSKACLVKSTRQNLPKICKSDSNLLNAKCPLCEKYHYKETNYTGNVLPRFFCDKCIRKINFIENMEPEPYQRALYR